MTWRYAAHLAVNGEDVSRVDMRLNADGKPCLIEINTLPGLTPDFSDLCVLSKADGISYQELILGNPLPGRLTLRIG